MAHTCHDLRVDVRGQLLKAISLLPLSRGLWGLNSGLWVCTARILPAEHLSLVDLLRNSEVGKSTTNRMGSKEKMTFKNLIYLFIIFLCIICVRLVSVWHMYMYVHGYTCVCASQRKSVLLYHTPSCSFEEGTLSEPAATFYC